MDILDSVKYFGGIVNIILLFINNIGFIDVGEYCCGVNNFFVFLNSL